MPRHPISFSCFILFVVLSSSPFLFYCFLSSFSIVLSSLLLLFPLSLLFIFIQILPSNIWLSPSEKNCRLSGSVARSCAVLFLGAASRHCVSVLCFGAASRHCFSALRLCSVSRRCFLALRLGYAYRRYSSNTFERLRIRPPRQSSNVFERHRASLTLFEHLRTSSNITLRLPSHRSASKGFKRPKQLRTPSRGLEELRPASSGIGQLRSKSFERL